MNMNARATLPSRRQAETFDVRFGEFLFTATLGRYEDGRPAEIFLNAHLQSTAIDIAARDTALMISFALQFHVPLASLQQACCRDAAGAPLGLAGVVLDSVAALEGAAAP